MEDPIFILFVVDKAVTEQKLNRIINEAYAPQNVERSPNILVATEALPRLRTLTTASTPPLPAITNTYYGTSISDLASLVRKEKGARFSRDYFLVADGQTAVDECLTVVMNTNKHVNESGRVQSFRIGAEWVCNALAAWTFRCSCFEEYRELARESGGVLERKSEVRKGSGDHRRDSAHGEDVVSSLSIGKLRSELEALLSAGELRELQQREQEEKEEELRLLRETTRITEDWWEEGED